SQMMHRRLIGLSAAVFLAAAAGCRSMGDPPDFETSYRAAQRAEASHNDAAFAKASREAEDATKPDDADHEASIGVLLLKAGRHGSDAMKQRDMLSRAAGHLDLALARRPDAVAWRFDRGLAALLLGDGPDAVTVLEEVNREAPGDDDARQLLARAYLAVGDDRAAADVLEAPSPAAHEAGRLELRGSALLLVGESKAAERCFTGALALAGDCPRILCNRALAREKDGDLAGARADYDRALKLDPTCSPAKSGLAELP
ncbi:MAG: tetratricopeptide repeat protein, partial [Polyangiaceae bacterium]